MRPFIWLLLLPFSWLLARFCEKQTDGFSVAYVSSRPIYHAEWGLPEPLNPSLQALLRQEFHYLGSGGQCYAFASTDGSAVLKLFKRKSPLLPFTSVRKKTKLQAKRERDFTSYRMAFDRLQEETGLLYVHLNESACLRQTACIVDKLGIRHTIDLDRIAFVLQRKADLVYPRLQALLAAGDQQGAERALKSVVSVIVARCKKGIYDEDPRIHRNFGFIGDQAVIIDVGRFREDPARATPAVYKEDAERITCRLRAWLTDEHPSLVPCLEASLHAVD